MALPRGYAPAPGGGYHFDLGDGVPIFAAGPEADAVAGQLYTNGVPPGLQTSAIPADQEQPMQIDPSIAAAATDVGPDVRTASAEDAIRASLGGGTGNNAPLQLTSQYGGSGAPLSVADVGAANAEPKAKPAGTSDAAKIAGALGVSPAGKSIFDTGADIDPRRLLAREELSKSGAPSTRAPSVARGGAGEAVGGGPVRYTRGGMMPVSKIIEGPAPVSEETSMAQKRAAQTQWENAEKQGELGKQQAEAEFNVRTGYQDEMKRLELHRGMQQRIEQDEKEAAMKTAQDTAQAARDGRIDENQVWGDTSDPMAVIGMILGFAGGSLVLGRDKMMDLVNKTVDRNIATQEKNLQNKRAAATEAQNLVGIVRQQHADSASQYLSARAAMLQSLSGQLEAEASKYKGTQAELNAQNMQAQIQKEFANTMAHLEQSTTERITQKYLPPGPIGGGGQVVDPKVQAEAKDYVKFLEEKGVTQAAADLDPMRQLVNKYQGGDGIPGYGFTADLADKIPGGRRLLSDEGRVNRAVIDRGVLGYRKLITGTGGSAEEMKAIEAAFKGSETPQELAAAVRQADAVVARRLNSISSGYDPRAVALARSRGLYVPGEAPPESLRRRGE